MKIFKNVCSVLFVAVLCVGVASAKKVKKPDIIDSKGMAVGAAVPKWVEDAVEADYSALLKDKELDGKSIFIAEAQGKNLDLLKAWVRNFEVSGNFSQALSNTVIAKSGANLEGDVDKGESERFLKELVGTFSQTSFSGLELKKDYWIKRRVYKDKKNYEDIYQYFVVYAIDKDVLKQQVANVLNKIEAKSPEQQRIKNETISVMDEAQAFHQNQ